MDSKTNLPLRRKMCLKFSNRFVSLSSTDSNQSTNVVASGIPTNYLVLMGQIFLGVVGLYIGIPLFFSFLKKPHRHGSSLAT